MYCTAYMPVISSYVMYECGLIYTDINLVYILFAAEVVKAKLQSWRTQYPRAEKDKPASGAEGGIKRKTPKEQWLLRNLSYLSTRTQERPSFDNLSQSQVCILSKIYFIFIFI